MRRNVKTFRQLALITFTFFFPRFFALPLQAQQEYPVCQSEIGWRVIGLPWATFQVSTYTDLLANNNQIVIAGTLIINQNTVWSQKHLRMNAGAQIVVASGVTFQLSTCVVEGCNYMWKGILMNGGATLILDSGTSVSDAVSAVESQGVNKLEVNTSELSRNFYGINYHDGNTENGFTPINMTIDGAGPLKPPYPGQSSSLYGPRGKAGMVFSNMNRFEVTNNAANNIIKNYEIGAWIKNNCVGGFFNINFENILWYENGIPHGTGILIENSRPNDPYGIIISKCTLRNCETGVDAVNSKILLVLCQINTSNTGIRVRNSLPNEDTEIAGCAVNGTNDGIILGPNPNSRILVHFSGVTQAASRGIYVTDESSAINGSRYVIEFCSAKLGPDQGLTPKNNENAVGIGISQVKVQDGNLIVQQNYVDLGSNSSGLKNTGIAVTNCRGATIRQNHVMEAIPFSGFKHVAMLYENTNFSYVECNDFLNTDIGLMVSGSQNTPTAIKTNQFKYHTSAGMVFDGITQSFDPSGDHIHAGNLWLYPTNVSNPGAVSTLGSTANAMMQFFVDATENQAFLPYVSGDNWFIDQDNQGVTSTCDPYSELVESGGATDRASLRTPDAQEQPGAEVALKVVPNPSFGSINVSWDAPGEDQTRLEIINVTGITVYATIIEAKGPVSQQVDGLEPGIYFCRIFSKGKASLVSKIVVQ